VTKINSVVAKKRKYIKVLSGNALLIDKYFCQLLSSSSAEPPCDRAVKSTSRPSAAEISAERRL